MSVKRPFVINPILTAIALGYVNAELIADIVAPRVGVGGEQFKYTVHGMEHFDSQSDLVGRSGRTNEVEFQATQADGSVRDHGLETPIPYSDIEAALASGGRFDPVANATLKLTKKIALNREIRVAGMVFAAATYPTGNKVQLTGNDQWNSGDAAADPVEDIFAAIDSMLIKPNMMVLGSTVANVLRRSSAISTALGGSAGAGAVVDLPSIASLFGLQRVVVGQASYNTAKPGQTRALGQIWGKHAALLRVDGTPTDMDEITFMATAQYGDKESGDWEDKNIGLRGGKRVRVGESVRELVLASDVGYLIEDAIA